MEGVEEFHNPVRLVSVVLQFKHAGRHYSGEEFSPSIYDVSAAIYDSFRSFVDNAILQ